MGKEGRMNLLDNLLVGKYFGCVTFGCNAETEGEPTHRSGLDCNRSMALRILQAMQEPIKKGEKIIVISSTSSIYESTAVKDHDGIHPFDIRLPTRFQPPAESKECAWKRAYCPSCHEQVAINHDAKPVIIDDLPNPHLVNAEELGKAAGNKWREDLLCTPPKDAVEEKIIEMALHRSRFDGKGGTSQMVIELRELIALARSSAGGGK